MNSQVAETAPRQSEGQPQSMIASGRDMSSHPLQRHVNDSPRQSAQGKLLVQLKGESASPRANGLPSQLRTGIEALSGMDMGSVVLHRNSSKPAQLNAHAYAQGNEIHLGPGQEKHLPHEAWHVVQQRQGRVRPTTQLAGTAINDNVGLEHEADVMGAQAAASGPTLQRVTIAVASNRGDVAQAVLKVGPKIMEEEHVEFLFNLIVRCARQIIDMWSTAERGDPSSPTWVAFSRGIAFAIQDHRHEVEEVLRKWITSSGGGTAPVIVESARERLTGVRGEKVHWKEFDDVMELTLAVGYELDPVLLENRDNERKLGGEIAENPAINTRLDSMRLILMRWIRRQYEIKNQDFNGFKAKFRLGGSYNLGNPVKEVARDWDDIIGQKHISFTANIEILHDLMELTSEPGGGSLMQKFGRVLAKTPEDVVYTQIGVDKENQLYDMTPMRSEFDHGPGGSAWRASKHYLLKQFDIEFEAFRERPMESEMLAIGEIPEKTREEKLADHYREKADTKLEKAANYRKKAAVGTLESARDAILVTLGLKSDFRPGDELKLHKQSKGRHNVGTRDEYDPVSVVARRFGVPIEAGRSMTTARLLTLCRQALEESGEREMHGRGKSELDAVANAIFAYWAAIYNQALTPVHTYHEVMDVARHFGVEYEPFHYRRMNEDMDTIEHVAMDKSVPSQGGKGKIGKPVEEVRDRYYRPSREQTRFLESRNQMLRWIEPNGDCLFNALAATGVEIGGVRAFRKRLADYLRNNPLRYGDFIAGGDIETVAQQIGTSGSYFNLGGDMSPLLIADMLQIGFTILNANGSSTDFGGGSGRHLIIRVTNPLPHFHTYQRIPLASDSNEIEMIDFSRVSH